MATDAPVPHPESIATPQQAVEPQPVGEASRPPVPLVATYRLQCTPTFTLHDAAAVTGYLRDLGVSHVYTSPLLQARPGSTHGYDVIDHRSVNAELGGEPGLDGLVRAVREHGLQIVVDIVPNHMAITVPGNRWWYDVLRNGRASRYAEHFDIDWDPPQSKLSGRILVPVLPDHYGKVLERGDLQLVRHHDEIVLTYADLLFPIAPRSVAELARRAGRHLSSEALGTLTKELAARVDTASADPLDREAHQEVLVLCDELAARWRDDVAVADAFDAALADINADPDQLDAILDDQHYRLAWWRTSGQELDYRRFFDVDDLVGVRTERREVFDEVHERVLTWAGQGAIAGVRIDHVDGLRDPMGYLCELRSRLPGAWIVVEKILEPNEALRAEWPVDGTTGYEFGALATGLFVDPSGEAPLTALATEFSRLDDQAETFDETLHRAKHDVMRNVLATEIERLTESFARVCENRRAYRDFARADLQATLVEVLAAFPVYRTYVDEKGGLSDEDVAIVEGAVGHAAAMRPDLDAEILELLRRILLLDPDLEGPDERELRARFQQTSPAIMAKSKEDTAFYRSIRLLALNEVGGDPARFGVAVEAFHEWCATAQRLWPATMLGLSTHDSKRSEDVRARLAVLSEMPRHWAATVRRWHDATAAPRERWPLHPRDELYLWQTIVGAHPISEDRLVEHARKALREAKVRTSWLHPDDEYEAAVDGFIHAVFADDALTTDIETFVAGLLAPGRRNALGQKLLQLTAPGVPDIYQGQELWDLSLVDPDNRRPIDYERRREALATVRRGVDPRIDLEDPADVGLAKMHVVERALAVRRLHPDSFGTMATYTPLHAEGPAASHVVAFARGTDAGGPGAADGATEQVVTIVPRLTSTLDDWGATLALPAGTWRDVFAPDPAWSGTVALAEVLASFPVSLLVRDGRSA